ncbi:hypothetical protein [Nonomuraea sp. SYSU D8015]|uniref:hypothetical protein n=1 Tax=Nonomuraea sp. SYSU D8015 TaxID=2593644 RepID=UPI0016616CDD|nr:hypothetical protein [Nonomuraea sp. SYSU D8015]
MALAGGAGLSVGALLFEEGEPPWQVLAVFALLALLGLGLRLESALRDRPRP